METVYYLIAAIVLYFAADRALDAIERSIGRRFEYRSIYFFGILTGSALLSFWLIRTFLAGAA